MGSRPSQSGLALDWMTWRPMNAAAPQTQSPAEVPVPISLVKSARAAAVPAPPAPVDPVPAHHSGPVRGEWPVTDRDDAMRRRLIVVASVMVVAVAVAAGGWWLVTAPPWRSDAVASAPGADSVGGADGQEVTASTVGTCSAEPVITPMTITPGGDGLTLGATMFTPCSGGDILSSNQTGVVVTMGSRLIAAASFDLSTNPVALNGDPRRTDLVFPPGSYFDVPSTDVDAQSFDVTVTQSGPRTTTQMNVDTGGIRLAAASPLEPSGVDTESAASAGLLDRVTADRDVVASQVEGRWVAQLSSKRVGLVAEGRTWDSRSILEEFSSFAARFDGARLLQSDDWSVFTSPGFLVTITAQSFIDAPTAVGWCRSQGFDRDHCLAKRISRTASPEGTTVYID